ncbi:MAG: hypothetical protein ABIO04_04635, partial [Ferruginibacter sp.]
MMKKKLFLFYLPLIFSSALFAQTWDGSASTDWNTAANWSTNAVPVAAGNVVIPGSLTNYPIMANNITINSLNMQAGSELDFNGFTLTITNAANYTYFIGATLKNSNAGADIVVNIMGGGGYVAYIRGTTVNDNITFNISGTNAFYDGDVAGMGNHYVGNANFNCTSTGGLYICDADTSLYDANLSITRTGAGITQAFNSGGIIGGNFAFTNNTAGDCQLGNIAIKTSIAGTVNITVNNTTPNLFQLYRLVNQTGGGIINVQNTRGIDIKNDTLIVTAFSATGYRSNAYAYLFNSSITGNVTFADDVTYSGGYSTYIRNNQISGTAAFSNNGSNVMYESDVINSGNHYTGSVSFNCTGTGGLYISDADTSLFDANLTISRTGAGITQAFNSGGVIGGNFAFTNNTAGNSLFGNLVNKTSIAGTVNITVNNTTPNLFQ